MKSEEIKKLIQNENIVLVDIGASGGMQDKWKKLKEKITFIGFEPDERAFKELKSKNDSKSIYFNTAVYKNKEKIDLYLTKRQEVSSIYKPNRKFLNKFPNANRFDVVEKHQMDADTIDNVLGDDYDIDLMKIDTQGSELDILMGAKNNLKNCLVLEVEVEFQEMYIGQPLFGDVDKFLRENGFVLFDLSTRRWNREGTSRKFNTEQVIYADALYVKDISSLQETYENKDSLSKSKLLKFIAIVANYNFNSYAIELLSTFKHYFTKTEYNDLLEKLDSPKKDRYKIVKIVSRVFDKLYKRLNRTMIE